MTSIEHTPSADVHSVAVTSVESYPTSTRYAPSSSTVALTLIVTVPPGSTVAEPTVRSLTLAARAMPRNASAATVARMATAAAVVHPLLIAVFNVIFL